MVDFIILIVIGLIVGLAGGYVYKVKKAGKACIGCPDSGKCGANGCSGNCSGCSCGK